MIKSILLPATILLFSSTSFGQNEQSITQIAPVKSAYRSSDYQTIEEPSTIYTPQVVQGKETSKDVLDTADPEMISFGVSPNPTKGYLTLTIAPALIGSDLQVIDMTGRSVGNPIPITATSQGLTLKGKKGVYFISIRTEDRVLTKRVILDK